ncbi:MAG TPA: hypothetical protein VFW78_04345 [Bacteroidia bacterium]|nr:hypothetical protein [Bacteroidia bacterium]
MKKKFEFPQDLHYNEGPITDPTTYFKQSGCESWLCLTGEEFAKMENGLSFQQVQESTHNCINIISDPPMTLNLDLAKQQVEALDSLPRPTLISCRMGPRSSAVAYMYAGFKLGSNPKDVIEAAEKANAPFVKSDEYKAWVCNSIEALRSKSTDVKNED